MKVHGSVQTPDQLEAHAVRILSLILLLYVSSFSKEILEKHGNT